VDHASPGNPAAAEGARHGEWLGIDSWWWAMFAVLLVVAGLGPAALDAMTGTDLRYTSGWVGWVILPLLVLPLSFVRPRAWTEVGLLSLVPYYLLIALYWVPEGTAIVGGVVVVGCCAVSAWSLRRAHRHRSDRQS
jgi:hypothetical protein